MPASPGIPVHLTALGVPITLRAHGAHAELLHAALASAWSRCARPGDDDGVVLDVALGPAETLDALGGIVPDGATFGHLDAAMDGTSSMVTMAAIEHQAGELLMLHACAVADLATGRTIALVGPSGAGKTTAAGALCRALAYVSDETVGVTGQLTVVPYPKPLSLKSPGSPFKRQVSPDELGYATTDAELSLHAVLLLDRIPGYAGPVLESVPRLRGLTEMASETSYLAKLEAPLHRLAEAFSRGPGLQRIRYGEVEQIVDVVPRMFHP